MCDSSQVFRRSDRLVNHNQVSYNIVTARLAAQWRGPLSTGSIVLRTASELLAKRDTLRPLCDTAAYRSQSQSYFTTCGLPPSVRLGTKPLETHDQYFFFN
jgi:hypothetical protein